MPITVLSVPLGSPPPHPHPDAHTLTQTQQRKASWFFHAGTGCPWVSVPGAVPPHEVTRRQGQEQHTALTVTVDYSVD